MNKVNIIIDKYLYFFIVSIGVLAILLSYPFLRYPYDVFYHLIVVDDLYRALEHPIEKYIGIWANDMYVMIQTGENEPVHLARDRHIWHYGWAMIFHLFHVESSQMFFRAKIIHIVQTYIALFSLYYFSNVVIRNIFTSLDKMTLRYLSLWSVVVWLSIFATFSGYYHQIWMMWYSVNYQITLALFWYMTALTIVLFLEKTSLKKKIFFVFQIVLISRFILQAHSMEFMYYSMYLFIFALVYGDKIVKFIKKYFYLFIPSVWAIWYFIKHYQPEHSRVFDYMHLGKLPELYEKIMHEGEILLHNNFNRAFASINELMYFIGIFGIILCVYFIFMKSNKIHINQRMLLFIGITSLFLLIPLNQFSGGLFAMMTRTNVVNRLYYSSSLFVILPIAIYVFAKRYHLKLRTVNIVLFFCLVAVYTFSKYSNILHHNYYQNIQSIQNSFNEKKVGFNLNQTYINMIQQRLQNDERENTSNKPICYYARADIAFVIKYLFHKKVYWEGRRANLDYVKKYQENTKDKSCKNILFKIPKNFPLYKPYT